MSGLTGWVGGRSKGGTLAILRLCKSTVKYTMARERGDGLGRKRFVICVEKVHFWVCSPGQRSSRWFEAIVDLCPDCPKVFQSIHDHQWWVFSCFRRHVYDRMDDTCSFEWSMKLRLAQITWNRLVRRCLGYDRSLPGITIHGVHGRAWWRA